MGYYLAPSLVQLRAECNARWPGRQKYADGWIGDPSHQARVSDHNPDWSAGGVVRAIDVTAAGIDSMALVRAACADPRTNYVIHRRWIYQRIYGFRARPYFGSNPHTKHVHISIRHGRTWENDRRAWLVNRVSNPGTSTPAAPNTPTPAPITERDWLDMATKAEVTEAVREGNVPLVEAVHELTRYLKTRVNSNSGDTLAVARSIETHLKTRLNSNSADTLNVAREIRDQG